MNSTLEKRKINLVRDFLSIDNKDTVTKIELLLQEEKVRIYEEQITKRLTQKQLNGMLDKAEDDFKNGRFITSDELLKKAENW